MLLPGAGPGQGCALCVPGPYRPALRPVLLLGAGSGEGQLRLGAHTVRVSRDGQAVQAEVQ